MKDNDIRYLIFLILLTFLVSATTSGCASAPEVRQPPTVRCGEPQWAKDVRCQASFYQIEQEPELDDFEEVEDVKF